MSLLFRTGVTCTSGRCGHVRLPCLGVRVSRTALQICGYRLLDFRGGTGIHPAGSRNWSIVCLLLPFKYYGNGNYTNSLLVSSIFIWILARFSNPVPFDQ